MIQYKKILMTLALLLTAVTGAWAQSSLGVKELAVPATWNGDNTPLTAADLPGFKAVTLAEAQAWKGAPAEGNAILIYAFDDNKPNLVNYSNGVVGSDGKADFTKKLVSGINAKFYYTAESAEPAIDVKWDAATKTGTFTMPAFDVEIAPIYAPTAMFATDGEPTAIEGIIAGEAKAIVNEGTVALMSDEQTPQGEVMYFATTDAEMTAEKAAKADGWLATVPTAEGYDGAQTVYVWYYIKGADTPQEQTATAENTFNDSEICTTPLKVTVLSNKFDIQFKAANANTIEGQNGKGTVTVKTGDAEAVDKTADIDENHQLKAVKMGSEVKVTAKEGYKFRKVEVKKGEKLTLTVGDMVLDITGCTTWADVIAKNSDKIEAKGPVVVQKDNHDKYIGPSVTTSSPVDTSVNCQWYEAN